MLNLKWKIIEGYADKYAVSNDGQVKSLERLVPTSRGNGQRRVPERILSQRLDGAKNYLQVNLWSNNKERTISVHTLVATAFCPKEPEHTQVNHIDGDKLKNNACNLEWTTSSQNIQHAHDTGLQPKTGLSGTATRPTIGRQWGASSKYHNVSFAKREGKWVAGVKHNRKNYKQKMFDSELEAALYVDTLLDEIGDTVRPRNSTLINA